MERAVGKNENMESFCLSWKVPSEVGKSLAKLERSERSWRQPSEVGKKRAKLESFLKLGSFAAVGEFK